MKKYIQWITLSFLLLLGASCQRDIVSGLDGSVDQRINNLIKGYVDQLQSSQYGWMVSVNTSQGYYQFWMSFPQGNSVIMYTDNTNYSMSKQIPDTSTFAFKALQRPTLIFDTYSYLSYINDPDPAISGAASGYSGLHTDFEFEVDSVKTDIFYMTGLINRAKAVFRRATANDLKGVQAGWMMDLPAQVATSLANYNIMASYNGTEIVVKVSSNRLLYTFWYNDNRLTGDENTGYFNVEVDGSGDLFFPEPVVTATVSLVGLKYDNNAGKYVGFYTADGKVIPVTISFDAPDFSLSKIFGFMESKKLFKTLQYKDGLATPVGGTTSSSLNFLTKGFGGGAFILGYDLHYQLQTVNGFPELAIFFQPTNAIGVSIYDGKTWTTSYPASEYRIPITIQSSDSLTFQTSGNVVMDTPGQIYYDKNVTKEMIDNFKNKTFKVDWSTTCRSTSGLVVQLLQPGAASGAFLPPALLAK